MSSSVDVVVAGAGAAGPVIAACLSEDPTVMVDERAAGPIRLPD
jgi:hypothetical protein